MNSNTINKFTKPIYRVSLNHDGTDGTGIQSVSPVPSASVADSVCQ